MSRDGNADRRPRPETDAWDAPRGEEPPGVPPGRGSTDAETTRETGESGDWFGEELGFVALGLGVLLFAFPEPASSVVGFFLILLGVAEVAADSGED